MKKNDTRPGKNTPLDMQAKRQMEDRIFNKMLVWLAAAAVVEIFFVVVNRYYVHARAGEISGMVAWHTALLVLLFVGIALFAVFLLWGRKQRGEGKDVILPYVLAASCLVTGLCSFFLRLYGQEVSHLVLAAVPGLAVLALVFYLYQKEFFPCVLVGELGILALLVFRGAGYASTGFITCMLIAGVVMVALLAFALRLQKSDGTLTVRGEPVEIVDSGAAYSAYYLTVVVTALTLLLPMVLGSAIAYYGIWILGAWQFILAVYFTSKLM